MTIRSLPIFIILAALAVGCKSGDAAADTSKTDTPKMASKATTGDAAKPADTTPAPTTPDAAPAASSITGTWTTDDDKLKDVTVEFKDDGTAAINGIPAAKDIIGNVQASYKIEGDKITLTNTGMQLIASDKADPKLKAAVEAQNKKSNEDIKKQKPTTGTLAIKDKDTFTITDLDGPTKGKVTTFKRKA